MNKLRKQSDTTYPLFFFMVDSTDHVTGKTGLSPTVTISKNGGSFASTSGAVTEVGNGLYKVAGNATDSNTVGELWIHATGTAADPTDTSYTIVAYDPFDSVRLGLTALPNAAAEASGGLYTRGSGAGQINQPANGQIDANTVKVSGTTQTARDLGASVLLSSGTGTGQLDITSGVVKSNMTQIDGLATNGNNAALKLKTLDIRSDDKDIPSVNIIGALATSGRGGTGLNIIGGAGSSASKGYAVFTSSGSGNGTGYGVIFGAVNGGDTGMLISGASVPAIEIVRSGSNNAVNITGGSGVGEITANIVGSINSLGTQAKADVASSVWTEIMESGITAEELMRGFASALLGKSSDHAAGTPKYRDMGDTKDRISATTDADGNRTSVTKDLT